MMNIETRHLFSMAMKTQRQPFGRTPLGERSSQPSSQDRLIVQRS